MSISRVDKKNQLTNFQFSVGIILRGTSQSWATCACDEQMRLYLLYIGILGQKELLNGTLCALKLDA